MLALKVFFKKDHKRGLRRRIFFFLDCFHGVKDKSCKLIGTTCSLYARITNDKEGENIKDKRPQNIFLFLMGFVSLSPLKMFVPVSKMVTCRHTNKLTTILRQNTVMASFISSYSIIKSRY